MAVGTLEVTLMSMVLQRLKPLQYVHSADYLVLNQFVKGRKYYRLVPGR